MPLSRVPSYDSATRTLHRRPPRRSAPVLPLRRRESDDRSGRAYASGSSARLAGSEFVARRRQQGYLGAARRRLVLSRIAESLFWLARYIERAEGHGAHSRRELPHAAGAIPAVLSLALGAADRHGGRRGSFSASFMLKRTAKTFSNFWPSARTIRAPSSNASRKPAKTRAPSAIASPAKCGRTLTAFLHGQRYVHPRMRSPPGPHRFCDKIKFGAHRFHGVTDATLPHDEGWEFLRVGWALERAEMTARLVDVQYHNLLDGCHRPRRP